jgi:hypothetical protein
MAYAPAGELKLRMGDVLSGILSGISGIAV